MAHALQFPSNMTNTKAFASIDINTLSDVQGGCGGRRRCHGGGCGTRTKNVSIVNNYGAAPAPAPAAPAQSNSGVSVSVGYQQA